MGCSATAGLTCASGMALTWTSWKPNGVWVSLQTVTKKFCAKTKRMTSRSFWQHITKRRRVSHLISEQFAKRLMRLAIRPCCLWMGSHPSHPWIFVLMNGAWMLPSQDRRRALCCLQVWRLSALAPRQWKPQNPLACHGPFLMCMIWRKDMRTMPILTRLLWGC